MKSWLTTHYPHPDPDTIPWHIYLQDKYKSAVDGISIGDEIFFYEYKYQKPLKDGTEFPRGRVGIVRIAFVSGAIYSRDAEIEYANGDVTPWLWGVPTDHEDEEGFVGRGDVLKVLGYNPGGYLRGFNAGKGVMQLNNAQAYKLTKLFKQGN